MGHPNLSDDVNRNIDQSDRDGGVFLTDVPVGTIIKFQTRNTKYTIVKTGEKYGDCTIQGHPKYCPIPTKAYIHGSTWGGSMIKMDFVGKGMHLEFSTDEHKGNILTTEIQSIELSLKEEKDEPIGSDS